MVKLSSRWYYENGAWVKSGVGAGGPYASVLAAASMYVAKASNRARLVVIPQSNIRFIIFEENAQEYFINLLPNGTIGGFATIDPLAIDKTVRYTSAEFVPALIKALDGAEKQNVAGTRLWQDTFATATAHARDQQVP